MDTLHTTLRLASVVVCTLVLAACATSLPDRAVFGSDSDAAAPASDAAATEDVADAVEPARYQAREVFGAASGGGCLPCEQGTSAWHVRGVFGWALFSGDDDPTDDAYFGADLGYTSCEGCWGVDLFYRAHAARFTRDVPGTGLVRNDGDFSHLGVKLTYQGSFSSSFFWWLGVGPEFWWTDGYPRDEDGFGFFLEAGFGVNLSGNARIRAGVNMHGFDTDLERLDPADTDNSRFLLVFSPVVQLELSF